MSLFAGHIAGHIASRNAPHLFALAYYTLSAPRATKGGEHSHLAKHLDDQTDWQQDAWRAAVACGKLEAMSSQLDRLRRLVNLREQRLHADPTVPPVSEPDAAEDADAATAPVELIRTPFDADETSARAAAGPPLPLHQTVSGAEIMTVAGPCYVSVNAYPLHEARGPHPLGNLLDLPPALFHRFHPTFGLDKMVDYRRAAFIDTETTGLGGGAGIYAFMVGVGTFETWQATPPDMLRADPVDDTPTHFVVRQFFMRNPAEERALLLSLADLLMPYEMTVTFNGRTFDLPLLRTRYLQNRRFLPDLRGGVALLGAERPHLDLLLPARRVWRRRLQSCRLINLEQMILGLQRSEEDVPGHLIPYLYADYVRSSNANAMRRVFYHNAEDIVSMVALADHLGRAFGSGTNGTPAATTVQGLDHAGLARAYEQAGAQAQAEAAYQRALETVRNPADRADLYRRLAELQKRQGRWEEAAANWQTWLSAVPGTDPTPYIELAKYCEWQRHDLEQAEMWTAWALHNLRAAHPTAQRPREQAEIEHRLARLQRKRQGQTATSTLAD